MLRLACCLVACWSAFAAPRDVAAEQEALPTPYQPLVDRYLEGDHVRAVVDLLGLPASDAARDGRAELERVNAQYARPTGRAAARRTPAGPTVAQLDERLRAVAALHLEAAVAVPLQADTTRRLHLRVSEQALEAIGKAQARRATQAADGEIDEGVVDVFMRDWFLVVLTHLHRIGAIADALRVSQDAEQAFPDDADVWLIRGSLLEVLATSGVTRDVDRARVYPALRPEDVPAAAIAAARAAFERARRLAPDSAEVRLHLARVLALQGELRQAMPLLDVTGDNPRQDYLAALLSGGLAAGAKQFDRAAEHYRRATAVLPHSRAACIGLAHALAMGGRAAEARATLRPCLLATAATDDPWLRYPMGPEWLFEPAVHAMRAHVRGATTGAP